MSMFVRLERNLIANVLINFDIALEERQGAHALH